MNVLSFKRDVFFDALKFVLIAFVILGHFLERGNCGRFVIALLNTIYSFHMPLFVFVSGYFSKRYEDRRDYFKKIIRLLESYFIFQTIAYLLFNIDFTLSFIYNPWWLLWYLVSLCIWKSLLQFAPSFLLRNKFLIILLSVIISLGAGFIPLEREISFQRTMTFLPFYIIGFVCSNSKVDVKRILKHTSNVSCILYFIIIFNLFYFSSINGESILGLFHGANKYHSILGCIARSLQIILGLLGGCCMMRLIESISFPSVLIKVGSNTLFYYLYHGFLILGFCYLVRLINLPLTLLHKIICFFVVMFVLYLLSHIKLLHYLINPISNFYDKKNINCGRS